MMSKNKKIAVLAILAAAVLTACTFEKEPVVPENVVYHNEEVKLSSLLEENNSYVFMDVNGGNKKELALLTDTSFYVISLDENQVIYEGTSYDRPVEGIIHGVLYCRNGGAPTHIDYAFTEIDNKNKCKITKYFSWYDDNENEEIDDGDMFLYDDEDLTIEQWNEHFSKYIDLVDQEIQWQSFE